MDNQKVDEVLKAYDTLLEQMGAEPVRFDTTKLLPTKHADRPQPSLRHLRWMCQEVLSWPAERLEKKFRWLGFIQGVLWSNNLMPVEQLKRDNMPKEEEYRA